MVLKLIENIVNTINEDILLAFNLPTLLRELGPPHYKYGSNLFQYIYHNKQDLNLIVGIGLSYLIKFEEKKSMGYNKLTINLTLFSLIITTLKFVKNGREDYISILNIILLILSAYFSKFSVTKSSLIKIMIIHSIITTFNLHPLKH